jgi:hypothetical protein
MSAAEHKEAMRNFAKVKAFVDKHQVNYWDAISATIENGTYKTFRNLHEIVVGASGEETFHWSHTYEDTKRVLDSALDNMSVLG